MFILVILLIEVVELIKIEFMIKIFVVKVKNKKVKCFKVLYLIFKSFKWVCKWGVLCFNWIVNKLNKVIWFILLLL